MPANEEKFRPNCAIPELNFQPSDYVLEQLADASDTIGRYLVGADPAAIIVTGRSGVISRTILEKVLPLQLELSNRIIHINPPLNQLLGFATTGFEEGISKKLSEELKDVDKDKLIVIVDEYIQSGEKLSNYQKNFAENGYKKVSFAAFAGSEQFSNFPRVIVGSTDIRLQKYLGRLTALIRQTTQEFEFTPDEIAVKKATITAALENITSCLK